MRIAIFVDGSNLYFQCRDHGWFVDMEKLIRRYLAVGAVVDACYYVAVDYEKPKSSFLTKLPRTGFSLISKPLKNGKKADVRYRKGNMDVEIALGISSAIDTFDMAVLVSGDGDFAAIIEYLRMRGKIFQVLSHESAMGVELREISGVHYLDLESLKSDLIYESSRGDDLADFEELFHGLDELPEIYPR